MNTFSNNNNYIFYDSENFASSTYNWLGNIQDNSLSGVFYSQPTDKIAKELIIEKADNVILNYGNISRQTQLSLNNFETQILQNNLNAEVYKFSQPENKRRVHIKNLEGIDFQNKKTSIFSTGNYSENAFRDLPQSKIIRKTNYFIKNITKEISRNKNFTDELEEVNNKLNNTYQLNVALEVKDSKILNQLDSIKKSLAQNKIPQSTENILMSKDYINNLISKINSLESGSTITIASAYLDHKALTETLVNAEVRNINIRLLINNPQSNITAGGNKSSIQETINKLSSAGAEIFMPDEDDPLLLHYKLALIENEKSSIWEIYLGSDNATEASYRLDSIDYMLYLKNQPELYQQIKTSLDKDIDTYLNKVGNSAISISNSQIYTVATKNISAPSNLTAEYLNEIALYNAARSNASQSRFDYEEGENIMSGIYRLKYLAKTGKHLEQVPDNILKYDRELLTTGLGVYLNEYAYKQGWGKIYEDKLGAIPSLIGLGGKLLDRSFLYYSFNNFYQDDYSKYLSPVDVNQEFSGYQPEGFFESSSKFITNFSLVTASGILAYFSVGLPLSIFAGEAYKFSVQGLLDYSLQPSNKVSFKQGVARSLSLGFDYLKEDSNNLLSKLKNELINNNTSSFYNKNFSLNTINNIYYRQRGKVFYDNIIAPFILDVINPYSQTINNKVNPNHAIFLEKVFNLGEEIGKFINLEIVNNKPFITNIGFDRAKSIAKAVDELGLMIPVNFLHWGLGRKNLPNPQNFLAMSDVFNFTDLLNFFHQTIGSTSSLSRTTEIINNKSAWTKIQSIFSSNWNFNFSLFKNWSTSIISNLQTSPYNFLTNYPAFKSLQSFKKNSANLVKNNNLYLEFKDNDFQNAFRRIKMGEGIDEFLNSIIDYHENYHKAISYSKDIDDLLISQSNKLDLVNKIRSPGSTRIVANRLITNRGIGAAIGLSILNAHLIFTDLFKSSQGVSLWTQFKTNFFGDEYTPSVEFAGNRLLPTEGKMALLTSLGFSTFAVTAGLIGGMQLQSKFVEKFNLETPVAKRLTEIFQQRGYKNATQAAENLIEVLSNQGLRIPKGGYLAKAGLITFGILGARWGLSNLLAGSFNVVNWLLGKQGLVPNESTLIASNLLNFQTSVLNQIKEGKNVSSLLRLGAYQAGIYANSIQLFNSSYFSNTKVIAQQAPVAWFQFFVAETIKGENKEKNLKGIKTWSFGMQTAPVLGGTFAYAFPIAYHSDRENVLDRFMINQDKLSINNYFNSIGTLGATVFLTESLLDSSNYFLNLISKEKKIRHQNFRLLFNYAYGGLDLMMQIPYAGFNAAKVATFTAPVSQLNMVSKLNYTKHIKSRGLIGAVLGYLIGDYTYKNILDNKKDSKARYYTTIFGSAALGSMFYASSSNFNILQFLQRNQQQNLVNSLNNQNFKFLNSNNYQDVKINKLLVNSIQSATAKHWLPFSVFLVAGMMMTDSGRGYSYGMDLNDQGEANNWQRQLSLATTYATLHTTAFSYFSHWGNNPYQTLNKYQKISQKYLNNNLNTIARHHKRVLEKDLRQISKAFAEYKFFYGKQSGTIINSLLTNQNVTPEVKAFNEALETLNEFDFKNIHQLLDDQGNFNKYGQAFQTSLNNIEFTKWYKNRANQASRLTRGLKGNILLTAIAVTTVIGGGLFQGGINNRDAVDKFYTFMDTKNNWISDLFRLLTGLDRTVKSEFNISGYDSNLFANLQGFPEVVQGLKLSNPQNPNTQKINKAIQNIVAPMVIDPSNMFIPFLFGGVSIRPDKNGNLFINPYTQFQAAANDYSIANYNFARNSYGSLLKTGKLGILINHQLQLIEKKTYLTSAAKQKEQARLLLAASASLQPLPDKHRRKYSFAEDILSQALMSSDELISFVIRDRDKRTQQASYQPLPSLVRRMVDTSDPSQVMPLGDIRSGANLFQAISKYLSKDEQLLLSDSHLINFIYHLTNPLGRTGGSAIGLYWNKELNKFQGQEFNSDVSEWLSNIAYDRLPQQTQFNLGRSIKNNFSNYLDFFRNIPFVGDVPIISNAIAIASGLLATSLFIGGLSSFFFQNKTPTILDAANDVSNLFNLNQKVFKVQNISSSPKLVNNRYTFEIVSRNKSFSLELPITSGLTNLQQQEVLLNLKVQLETNLNTLASNFGNLSNSTINNVFETLESSLNSSLHLNNLDTSILKNYLSADLIEILIENDNSLFKNIFSLLDDTKIDNNLLINIMGLNSNNNLNLNNLKNELKSEIFKAIDRVLERELASNINNSTSNFLKRYKYLNNNLVDQSKFIGNSIINELLPIFKRLSENLYILTPIDSVSIDYRNENILNQIRKTGNSVGVFRPINRILSNYFAPGINLDVTENTQLPNSKYSIAQGQISKSYKLKQLGGIGLKALGIVGSAFEAFDILSGFNDLADLQKNNIALPGEIYQKQTRAGSILVTSLIGSITIPLFLQGVVSGSTTLLKYGKQAPGKLGLILTGISLSLYAGGKLWSEFGDTKIIDHFQSKIGDAYYYSSTAIGSSIYNFTSVFGENFDSDVTNFIGGATTAVLIGLAFIGTKGKIKPQDIQTLSKIGLISGIGYTAINRATGLVRDVINNTVDTLSRNPLGQMLITPLNYVINNPIFEKRNNPNLESFFYGTFAQAIQNEELKIRSALQDPTGAASASRFLPEFSSSIDPDIRDVFISGNISPFQIVDPLIRKELNLRAAYFNQTIVGKSLWFEKIKTSSNYKQLLNYSQSSLNNIENKQADDFYKGSNQEIKNLKISAKKLDFQKIQQKEFKNLIFLFQQSLTALQNNYKNKKLVKVANIKLSNIKNEALTNLENLIYQQYDLISILNYQINFNKEELEFSKDSHFNNDLLLAALPGIQNINPQNLII